MLNYTANDRKCRSRQLLSYFGEKKSAKCSQCDVCLSHSSDYMSEEMLQPAKEQITELLSDRRHHNLSEVANLPLDSLIIDEALEQLLADEVIYNDGNTVILA